MSSLTWKRDSLNFSSLIQGGIDASQNCPHMTALWWWKRSLQTKEEIPWTKTWPENLRQAIKGLKFSHGSTVARYILESSPLTLFSHPKQGM